MRLIDADDILPMMERTMDMQDLYLPIHFQEMVIDEMPTVDAVQVVRCKDCAKRGTLNCDLDYCGYRQADDWYCADGERREE